MLTEVPDGYHIEVIKPWGDCLINDIEQRREFFRLTDRPFEDEINHHLGYLPSQILDYLIRRSPERVINVLDVGGGRLSASVIEIAETYDSRVHVTNLELVGSDRSLPQNVEYMQGDICEDTDIKPGSIDFAYSFQVLTHFVNDSKRLIALRQIARMLAPGGVALIDDKYFSQMGLIDPRLTDFIIENSVFAMRRRGNSADKGKVVFGVGPWPFLMMIKEPFDEEILRIREVIVGHI